MSKNKNIQLSVMHRFDVFVKKVIKHAAMNYDKAKSNHYCGDEMLSDNIADEKADFGFNGKKKYVVCGEFCEVKDEYLADLIDTLPDEIKNVLLLYYFCNLSEPEIADLFKISKMAVNKRKQKALDTMRELLENDR